MDAKRRAGMERLTRRLFTRIITSLSRLLQKEDLSVAQVAALYLIDEHGGMRVGDVAGALERSNAATSRMLDQLVNSGLLSRREDPEDRRARVLDLTPEGRTFISRAGDERVKTILTTIGDMQEQAAEVMLGVLMRKK